eukprot:728481-Prorocentrum_minimum.AAC.1
MLYVALGWQAGGYPGTGKADEVGEERGEGTTMNIPLPGNTGDTGMRRVMDELIAPRLAAFKPDVILVREAYQ